MNYYAWESLVNDDDIITLGTIDDGPQFSDWSEGKPLYNFRTDKTRIGFHKMFKKGSVLVDQLSNGHGFPIVNNRLLSVFKALNLPNIEYYPIPVVNHNGDKIEEEYTIIHPTAIVDCIDTDKTDLMWSSLEPKSIVGIYEIYLKENFESPHDVFLPKHWHHHIFVSEKVVNEIEKHQFTGVDFVPLDDEYAR